MFGEKRGQQERPHRWWWIGPILAGAARAVTGRVLGWLLNDSGPS